MDRATMHVVPDDGAILEEVAQTEEQVLREVGYRNYKQRARLINHPGVVRFNIRHFRRHTEPAVAHLLDPHFNGFDRGFEVKRAIRRPVRAGWRVPIVEEIDPLVIGKESVARVKAGRRWK